MENHKRKPVQLRCISVAEEAERYFAEVMADESITGTVSRRLCKVGYLLGAVESCIKYEKKPGEMLVMPADEIARLLREATEVKEKK